MAEPTKPPRGNDTRPPIPDALVREFRHEAEKAGGQITNRLRLMVRKLVGRAISGDLRAIEDIHDRVDEPDQQDDAQTEDEPVNLTFEWKAEL